MPLKKVFKKRFRKAGAKKSTYNTIKKIVKKTLNKRKELKYNDVSISYNMTQTPFTQNLYQWITQGDAYNQREGDKIYVKGFKINALIVGDDQAVTTDYFANYRWWVMSSYNPNGTSLTAADFLTTPSGSSCVMSLYNFHKSKMYKRHFDSNLRSVPMGWAQAGTDMVPQSNPMKHFDRYIPINHVVQFNAGGTTRLNFDTHIFGASDQLTYFPTFTGTVRIYYYDM